MWLTNVFVVSVLIGVILWVANTYRSRAVGHKSRYSDKNSDRLFNSACMASTWRGLITKPTALWQSMPGESAWAANSGKNRGGSPDHTGDRRIG